MSARSLNWLKFGGLVALAFALGLLFAGLLDLPTRSSAQDQVARGSAIPTVQPPSIPEARPLAELSDALAAVADRVRPSVVYIRAQRTERTSQRRLPPGMERFFPRFGPNQRDFEQGSGSGFIVSADGYVLTNNHVVEGAENVIVRLLDRREFKARVVGTDANTDVAVLKLDARNLPPVALGNVGYRQRQGKGAQRASRTRRGQHPGLHPDRRGDQPGELGWAPRQRAR
jgi:S1-C subfamily serine protease